ncbi:MAG: CinA family protein [Oligoflexus sp.]
MLIEYPERCLEIVKKIQAKAPLCGLKLSTAESCTGGLLATLLTHYPGSSRFYLGGICAYSNEVKMKFLNVPKKTLDEFGAVSEETARAMARGALEKFNGNFAISVTGIAGPDGGTATKPVGTICCGFASSSDVTTKTYHLGKDRTQNRSEIAAIALEEAYLIMQQQNR